MKTMNVKKNTSWIRKQVAKPDEFFKLLQLSTIIQQVTNWWNKRFNTNHNVVDLFVMIHIKASITTLNRKFIILKKNYMLTYKSECAFTPNVKLVLSENLDGILGGTQC
jgi:hypothetical protein